jgi:hypothetical protein
MKRPVQNIFLFICLLSVGFASDSDLSKSHRSIIKDIVETMTTEAVREFHPDSSAVAFAMDSSAAGNLVRYDIIETLTKHRVTVFDSPAGSEVILNVRAYSPSLHYGEAFAESFLGSKKVVRTISLALQFTVISQSDKKVLFAKSYTHSYSDTLLYSEVQYFNDPSIPFASVTSPQLSFFDSILEPVIVTVASAIAIYLFFTIRS